MFIPATAVVGASWISLWLEDETQFADIVSIILAIIFLSYSYNAVMPKVSYIKVRLNKFYISNRLKKSFAKELF